MLLDPDQINQYFDQYFTRTAFRIEALDSYDVTSDGTDVARYLNGEPEPEPGRKQAWLDTLRAERAAGKQRSRVHILATPLGGYLRYECEWGYAPNADAGEEIGIIDRSEIAVPDEIILEEFWLLDDAHLLLMHYDDANRLLGGEVLSDDVLPAYRRAAEVARNAGEPFAEWWARHPEEHRAHWAA